MIVLQSRIEGVAELFLMSNLNEFETIMDSKKSMKSVLAAVADENTTVVGFESV